MGFFKKLFGKKQDRFDEFEKIAKVERMRRIREQGPPEFISHRREVCPKCPGVMGITKKISEKEDLWVCNNCGYSKRVYIIRESQPHNKSSSDAKDTGQDAPIITQAQIDEAEKLFQIAKEYAFDKNWNLVFSFIEKALNIYPHHPGSIALLKRAYCPKCNLFLNQPSPVHSTVEYARFWRGNCPICETVLIIR